MENLRRRSILSSKDGTIPQPIILPIALVVVIESHVLYLFKPTQGESLAICS
jgi:hypothetical protein